MNHGCWHYEIRKGVIGAGVEQRFATKPQAAPEVAALEYV